MKAYELLSDPAKWTQGVFARDASGEPVESRSPSASCWCTVGAILKCYPPSRRGPKIRKVAKRVATYPEYIWSPDGVLIEWNDKSATHAEVIRVLKEENV